MIFAMILPGILATLRKSLLAILVFTVSLFPIAQVWDRTLSDEEMARSAEKKTEEGALRFRTAAPVLGMGEGARQFDRRGAAYSMRDGWAGWDRPTLGSWVAVPFLIGTDGWVLFVHRPAGGRPLTFHRKHANVPRLAREAGDGPDAKQLTFSVAGDSGSALRAPPMRKDLRFHGHQPL